MSVLNDLAALRRAIFGQRVERAAAILPATASTTYFTVTGGRVLITSFIGEVTTVFDGTVNSLNITFDPDGAGAVGDLCAATVCTSDAVGTFYTVSGVQADLLGSQSAGGTQVPTHITARVGVGAAAFLLPEGAIKLKTSATDTTGATAWTLTYIPYDDGAAVVAA